VSRKYSDGKAIDVTTPAATVINDGDLYRVSGWNFIAIGNKASADTDRTLAGECETNTIYDILLPAGITPTVGANLFWAANDITTFQRGDTNLALSGAAGQQPCAKVLIVKNAAGYAKCRIFQT
jgi:hypothetical protein